MSEEMQTDTPQPVLEAPEPEATTPPVAEAPVAPAAEAPVVAAAEAPVVPAAVVEEAAAVAMEAEGAPPVDPAPTTEATVAAAVPAPRGDRAPRADRPPREPRADRQPRDRDRPQGQPNPADRPKGQPNPADRPKGAANDRPRGGGNDRPRDTGPRPGDRPSDRRPDVRRPEGPVEIEYDKIISDSLYLDNQAHVLVARLRDLDAGTRSQLRRLYGAVRRACRAPEADRQHQFVMLRARLAYTIARHGLRSLDPLEKLLLQVTRRDETRGYDRFRDLFEAIIAYNE